MTDLGAGKWVKTRKPHRCAGCFAPITVGEVCYYFHGRWEGEWQDWRLHAECHQVWEADGCGEICGSFETPPRIIPFRSRPVDLY